MRAEVAEDFNGNPNPTGRFVIWLTPPGFFV